MKDKDLPLVSVAVITYNQKSYLRDCIESVLAQDYPNIEIVVADDCSTDGTQDMLREYEESSPGKFVLRLAKKNQGITPNSNLAHFSCAGKYIAWMGGDDLMLPGKLRKQVAFMEMNPSCAICYHNLDVFDSDTNKTLRYFNEKIKINGDIATSIRFGTFNGACSNMVRTEKTPKCGFDETIPVASDWLYWVETLGDGGTIDYIDEVLGRYRRHDKNVTIPETFITQNELDHMNTCNIIIAKFPQHFSDAQYAYSNKLLRIRSKISYSSVLWLSIRIRPSIKAIYALAIYFLTFGKIKL